MSENIYRNFAEFAANLRKNSAKNRHLFFANDNYAQLAQQVAYWHSACWHSACWHSAYWHSAFVLLLLLRRIRTPRLLAPTEGCTTFCCSPSLSSLAGDAVERLLLDSLWGWFWAAHLHISESPIVSFPTSAKSDVKVGTKGTLEV